MIIKSNLTWIQISCTLNKEQKFFLSFSMTQVLWSDICAHPLCRSHPLWASSSYVSFTLALPSLSTRSFIQFVRFGKHTTPNVSFSFCHAMQCPSSIVWLWDSTVCASRHYDTWCGAHLPPLWQARLPGPPLQPSRHQLAGQTACW